MAEIIMPMCSRADVFILTRHGLKEGEEGQNLTKTLPPPIIAPLTEGYKGPTGGGGGGGLGLLRALEGPEGHASGWVSETTPCSGTIEDSSKELSLKQFKPAEGGGNPWEGETG